MPPSVHGEPPAAFTLAFYALLVVGAGAAFKAGWELMSWWIG